MTSKICSSLAVSGGWFGGFLGGLGAGRHIKPPLAQFRRDLAVETLQDDLHGRTLQQVQQTRRDFKRLFCRRSALALARLSNVDIGLQPVDDAGHFGQRGVLVAIGRGAALFGLRIPIEHLNDRVPASAQLSKLGIRIKAC